MSSNRKIKGAKLLLLGTNVGTCDMVNYARGQGAYVIVTDYLPPEKSEAKQIANKNWMVDTNDIDTLEYLAKKNKIDGIFTGVSEFNLERVLKLCECLNLPFYCTREQWNTCSNKENFKKFCRGHNVPVPQEFNIDEEFRREDLADIKYPVIVKPVDGNAVTGISICTNASELRIAYKKALTASKEKKVIVEKYIYGDEISVHYTLKNGKMSLSCMMDKYLNNKLGTAPVTELNIYPSKHLDKYIKTLNDKVIKMFLDSGFRNGTLFIQGIANKEGFVFFEMGYRLSGAASYKFISRLNKINKMEMLVDYSLQGELSNTYELSLDNPQFKKFCCNLSLFSTGGIVGEIVGLDKLKKRMGIIDIHHYYHPGDVIKPSGTLHQIILRPFIIENTKEELINTINFIHSNVKVFDDKGHSMLHKPINLEELSIG